MRVSVLRTENDLKIIPTMQFTRSVAESCPTLVSGGLRLVRVSVLRTGNDLKIIPTMQFTRSVAESCPALVSGGLARGPLSKHILAKLCGKMK